MIDSSDEEFADLASAMGTIQSDKADGSSENKRNSDEEAINPKRPKKTKHRKSRINFVTTEREKDLDKILFGDKEGLIRKLKSGKGFFEDKAGVSSSELCQKPIVWYDSDDEEIDGSQLKRKFERITGSNPSWAQLNRKKDQDSDSDEEAIVTKSVGFLAKDTTSKDLPKGELSFKRLKNLNRTTEKEGRITSVHFHPRSTVGIVAGLYGMVSMFSIDGRENKKIHNIKYEKFSVYSCKLNGDELIVGGKSDHFHTYNLMSGFKQRMKLPRGVKNLKNFELSPCEKYMAVVGRYGEVHLLHSLTKELLCTMKQEYQSTSIKFSPDSHKLFSHSDDNEVTVFDIRTQRAMHRFVDDGCVNGTSLTISGNGKLLATGSRQGFVNIYECDSVFNNKFPKPLKAISNITTEITDMAFNPTAEILGICSFDGQNSVKLVHFPSATVVSNFPTLNDQIGRSSTLAFSPSGGYFAIGTSSSQVPLYRIRHYKNY